MGSKASLQNSSGMGSGRLMFLLPAKYVLGPKSTCWVINGSPVVKVSEPDVVSPVIELTVETTGAACDRKATGLFNRITRPTPVVSRFSGTLPTAGTKSGSP